VYVLRQNCLPPGGGGIRKILLFVVFFILDNDNQPWFKDIDVAEILGYEKSTNVINEDVGVDFKRKSIQSCFVRY
jgi:hypothetical protein